VAVTANARSGPSTTVPAALASEPVYIPVPGRAGMFVRTYPTVGANAPNWTGISLPRGVSSFEGDATWDNLNKSFLSSGREVQVEMEALKADEVQVVALKGSP